MDAATESNLLRAELKRVFAAPADVGLHDCESGTTCALVEGWPQPVIYRTRLALDVLRGLPTGSGSTEKGNAEACRVLERAGAFVSLA